MTDSTGIWSMIKSSAVVDILLRRAEDFIVFDLEHGDWSLENVGGSVLACRRSGKVSVLRIPAPIPHVVQKAWDLFPDVIQVSGLKAAGDFRLLGTSFEPFPAGYRGYSPWSQASLLSGGDSSGGPTLVPQVESVGFLEVLEGLATADLYPIGGLFVGRYDLSQSVGRRGEISCPEVMGALVRTVELCSKANLSSWTVAPNAEDAEAMFSLGFDNVSISSDRKILSGDLKI